MRVCETSPAKKNTRRTPHICTSSSVQIRGFLSFFFFCESTLLFCILPWLNLNQARRRGSLLSLLPILQQSFFKKSYLLAVGIRTLCVHPFLRRTVRLQNEWEKKNLKTCAAKDIKTKERAVQREKDIFFFKPQVRVSEEAKITCANDRLNQNRTISGRQE